MSLPSCHVVVDGGSATMLNTTIYDVVLVVMIFSSLSLRRVVPTRFPSRWLAPRTMPT